MEAQLITRIKNIANTEDKKRLLSNFFSLSFLQMFTYILPLLTLPYLVRVLGVEKFGLVMFAQAFMMFFDLFVDYGFILSATREVSVHREDKNKVTEIFSSVMSIKMILLLVSFIVISAIVYSFERFSADAELYYFTFLVVVGQSLFPVWFFQGMERMKYITIVNITSKLIFTILIFVVIQSPDDYIYVPVLNGFGYIVGGVISLWMVHRYFHQTFQFQSIDTLLGYFKDSTQYFLSRIANAGNYSYLVLIVGILYGNLITGYFSMAERLYRAYYVGISPLVQVIYPNMAKKKDIRFFRKVYYPTVVFFAIVTIILLFFSHEFLSLFYGVSNETVDSIFKILFFATFFGITNILIGYPLLGAMGYVEKANYGNIYGAVISFSYTTICYYLGVDILVMVYTLLINEIVSVLYRGYFVKTYIIDKKEADE